MGEKLTFAIADLHGRFDLLVKAYEAIKKHGGGTIVHLGDYVDRGPQSRNILDFLMHEDTIPKNFKRVVLKGNHEDMMVQTIREPLHPQWWIGNGGGATLISYGHAREGLYDPTCVPASHIKWLNRLPMIAKDKHRIYVHAGVDPTIPLDEQTEQTLLWKLYPDEFPGGHGDFHVVHGHHQFEDGPKCYAGRTDLDTLAWLTGRLVVGVFDDDKAGGPVDLLEMQGEPYVRQATPTPEPQQ
jgi:serine/threonine protein phosphatase 1